MKTQVTLLVPAYNYGRFIAQTLDSLLSQTLRDLELIVIDDASRDETPDIVLRYASDPRIRVVRHEQNQGHINSYNEGLAMARGQYVGIVSADDYCLRPDALERQVALFTENPRVGMVYSAHVMHDPDGRLTRVGHGAADAVRSGFDEFRSLMWGNYILHSGALLRRDVQSALGPYDPNLPQSGDWDLWLRAAAGYDVGYIAEPLYAYRLHRSNMQSKGIPPARQAEQNVRTLEKAFAALPPDAPADLWQMRAAAVRHALLQTAWFDLRNGRARRGWQAVLYALGQEPTLLASGELWRYLARLGALTCLGRAAYARLEIVLGFAAAATAAA
jgi:glycosyltransferase involved in cell wall biosynthesis